MDFLCVLISNVVLIASFHCHFSPSALIVWSIPMLPVDALTTTTIQPAFTTSSFRRRRVAQRRIYSLNIDPNNIEPDADIVGSSINDEEKKDSDNSYTTAILKVAYDGTYFRGWTAGNSEPNDNAQKNGKEEKSNNNTKSVQSPQRQSSKGRQSRRSRTLQRKGFRNGKIRTVVDTIRSSLAKIYGDVHPDQISIESCSRTDAGVHATSLVAQFYCFGSDDAKRNATQSGMSMRPKSHDDTSNYRPLPFDSDLTKLVFVLNRMLPPDVRIVAASPLPRVPSSIPTKGSSNPATNGDIAAFHPTLHTMGKTYIYKFAIGPIHDPLQSQYVWHLDGSSNRAVGMNGKRFSLERALLAANLFVNSTDGRDVNDVETVPARDYGAFRSAFRGTDRGRVQSTICKLWRCEILSERRELLPSWETGASSGGSDGTSVRKCDGSRLGIAAIDSNRESLGLGESPQTFTVVIMGDRFLYKMIRNIVGTIVAVGCGHLELEDVCIALDTGKWGGNQSGAEYSNKDGIGDSSEGTSRVASETNAKISTIRRICAPARGLTLVEVHYPEAVDFKWQTG